MFKQLFSDFSAILITMVVTFLALLGVLVIVASTITPAQAFRWEIDKNGELIPLYFRDGDYSMLFERIIYSSHAKVPDGMNSVTKSTSTGVSAVVNWYGDVNAECRIFRADLYYPNRTTPKIPKPELVDINIPLSYQRIPVESYSGTFCHDTNLKWNDLKHTVNETWVPGSSN